MAGIEPLAKSIRIWWSIDGVRDRETLAVKPTPENIASARTKAKLIQDAIDHDVFNRDQFFPNSTKRPSALFDYYLAEFMETLPSRVTPVSYDTYVSKINNHIKPYWTGEVVAKIDNSAAERWVYNTLLTKVGVSTVEDILMLFRQIWELWARKQKFVNDPVKYIKLSQKDDEEIDPLTKAEIKTVIESETDPVYKRFWTALIWTGLSIHEFIALSVEDLDTEQEKLAVKRGWVKGTLRVTKNRRRKRVIDLLTTASHAFASQIESIKEQPSQKVLVLERDHITYTEHELTWLWLDEKTGTHFTYPKVSARWRRHLKSCGVRHRSINKCRHTFASQVLSSGAVTAEWLAHQLGHSDTNMIHKHYGRFIPSESSHHINRLDKALDLPDY